MDSAYLIWRLSSPPFSGIAVNFYMTEEASLNLAVNEFKDDREVYTRAKHGFIREALGTLA